MAAYALAVTWDTSHTPLLVAANLSADTALLPAMLCNSGTTSSVAHRPEPVSVHRAAGPL